MRPPGSPAQPEKRRRSAVQLLRGGRTLSAVARQVHASVSSVFRWRQAYQREGRRGLTAKPTPGRPPGLSPGQKGKLVRLLVRGPLRAGYTTDLWTLARVAERSQHKGALGAPEGRVAPADGAHRDIIAQTQTLAPPGTDATVHMSALLAGRANQPK